MTGARILGLAVAAVMLVGGAVVTYLGLSYDGAAGEPGGDRTLGTLGPVLAGLGVALAIVVLQRRP
ncbi:hypothetical protein BKA08_000901 [Nocardioides marinisabuli]|uniref:DUF3185 family protein n=1 Tax=Nocardioides marinisabuli TaxID=419476 RepID=A0A7Y9JQH7_9ACTN|nr:hypothetical protein [Nocardioides marinisabuli]NYD56663.1 hypothetical protein [Nocardioides marinisabuli]